jgi:amino acid permease
MLVDSNSNEIPVCNIIDGEAHLYVQDKDLYHDLKRKNDFYKSFSIVMLCLTCLFLCIFTLNFSYSIWSPGNLFTFILMFVSGALVFLSYKQWENASSSLDQINLDGAPCQSPKDDNNMIHCPVSSYTLY